MLARHYNRKDVVLVRGVIHSALLFTAASCVLIHCSKNGDTRTTATSPAATTTAVSPITASPAPGTYTSLVNVTLSAIAGDNIYYTLNGTEPTVATGTKFTAAFTINTPAEGLVKARAFLNSGDPATEIVSLQYYYRWPTPTISHTAGSYLTRPTITITNLQAGITYRYTTDGSEPSASNGTDYATSMIFSGQKTLKVKGLAKFGVLESDTASFAFNITHGSAGCGTTGALTGSIDKTTTIQSTTRNYYLKIPATYNSNQGYRLVFVWHAHYGDAKDWRDSDALSLRAKAGDTALFIYPQGLVQATGGTGWNIDANGYDLEFFDFLYNEMKTDYCIDQDRVFSTGHSFGGVFSNTLGCLRSSVFRAIAPSAGAGPTEPVTCGSAMPALVIHGVNDNHIWVPYATGVLSRDYWINKNQCTATTVNFSPSPCVEYQGCVSGATVRWCAHPGDHSFWSPASTAIWDFFSSF